jgi:hypothetical protein
VAAVRDGRKADFDAQLEVVQAIQNEVFKLTAQLSQARQSLITALAGWQPEVQFRIALHRLGREVLKTDSPDIVNRWLYFVQELLIDSRRQDRQDLRPLFYLWEQVAILGDVPPDWNFWQRLHEYNLNLNMGLARAASERLLTKLRREALAFLISLRTVIVCVRPSHFRQVRVAADEVGQDLMNQWRGVAPASELDRRKKEFADELRQYKRMYWLGFAGWLLSQMNAQRLSMDEVGRQWDHIRLQFATLEQVWSAWRQIGRGDPFQWDWEESRERLAQAGEEGRFTAGGFSDEFSGTTLPMLLLSLGYVQSSALPREAGEAGLLAGYIEPIIRQVLEDDSGKWARFVTNLGSETLAERLELLRTRFKEVEHADEAATERRVAETPVDPTVLTDTLNRYTASIDREGLRLFQRLQTAGRVETVDDGDMLSVETTADSFPKISLIPEFGVPLIDLRATSIADQEDAAILARIGDPTRRIATSLDQLGEAIDAAIAELAARGTEATLIVLPWDWTLTRHVLARGGEALPEGPQGNDVGTYRGITLIRGLRQGPAGLCLVLSLEHLFRVKVSRPQAGLDVRNDRFVVELRPPTEDELQADSGKPAPVSRVGLPYVGNDLVAARQNRWRLRIKESISIELTDPGAVVVIEYRHA